MKNLISLFIVLLTVLVASGQNKNIDLLGSMTFTNTSLHGALNDVWGHVDSLGNEYAIVGLQKGISIVDVTNPSNLNEVFYVAGPSTIWRDIKTFDNHAYITNESSGGMMIIDMSALPGSITMNDVYYHTGSTYPFSKAHNLYIDEKGVAYIFGSNYGNRGAIFLDLNNNPKIPQEAGVFDSLYFHDGMARGDTLWGAAVYAGKFFAIDVSNKLAPVIMQSHFTSGYFAHNCWISDDGNTLFTTDEISGGAISSYDVSDFSNIDELDQIRSNPGSGVIPHNTHVNGDFIVTSYYRDGITIVDVTQPDRMVQVGDYDTSPTRSGNGFNGCWGVYPFLPSGNIIATDIENGLFVLGPDYTKGVYLKGNTRKFSDSSSVGLTRIISVNTGDTLSSNLNGFYKESFADSGWYQFAFYKPGYLPDTMDVFLSSGQMHTVDVYLRKQSVFDVDGIVKNIVDGSSVPDAEVLMQTKDIEYRVMTDSTGKFTISGVYEGFYEITSGKWESKSICQQRSIVDGDSILSNVTYAYYDDFTLDLGWDTISKAQNGYWEREDLRFPPYVLNKNFPIEDDTSDCSTYAYVTGSSSSGDHDLDGGWNRLISPEILLDQFDDPLLKFSFWFYSNSLQADEDSLVIEMTTLLGAKEEVFKISNSSSFSQKQWVDTSVSLSSFGQNLGVVKFAFAAGDFGADNIMEVGLDHFTIVDEFVGIEERMSKENMILFPNPVENVINYILPENFQKGQYTITDISGRLIEQDVFAGNKGTINGVSGIHPGYYMVHFYAEGQILSKGFVKR